MYITNVIIMNECTNEESLEIKMVFFFNPCLSLVMLLLFSHKPTTRFYMEMTIMDEKNNYNFYNLIIF